MLEVMVSAYPATQKVNFDGCAEKLQKISGKTFHGKST